MKKYVKMLKERKIKATVQRVKILQYLDTHRIHPTVETIYGDLHKDFPSLSKATIYNTLILLCENDLVEKINVCSEYAVYDIKSEIHNHFYCRECKEVFDVSLISFDQGLLFNECEGNLVENCQINFFGVCKACLDKAPEKSRGEK